MKDFVVVVVILAVAAFFVAAKIGVQFSNGTGVWYHLVNKGFDRPAQIGLLLTIVIGVIYYIYKKGRKGD